MHALLEKAVLMSPSTPCLKTAIDTDLRPSRRLTVPNNSPR